MTGIDFFGYLLLVNCRFVSIPTLFTLQMTHSPMPKKLSENLHRANAPPFYHEAFIVYLFLQIINLFYSL